MFDALICCLKNIGRRSFILILLTALVCTNSHAQSAKDKKAVFRSPLDIPLVLSGTFGELRTDHLHTGLDIKTNGEEGRNVYAVADGYISRIKVAATGFGKALYVTHTDGHVSVYAHMQKFNKAIQNYTVSNQYKKEKFELELFPEKEQFPVKQGDVIGLSGNTGGSEGPHLHFEIRDASSERPLNPMLFDLKINDFIRPVIKSLIIYPAGQNSTVDGKSTPVEFKVEGSGRKHKLSGHDTINITGSFYLGIMAYDQQNDAPNKNGIYSLEVRIDTSIVYSSTMGSLSFDETRYVNSLIDYPEFINNKRRFQKTLIEPNNKLSVYSNVKKNGVFLIDDSLIHTIEIAAGDAYGNTSILKIPVKNSIPDYNDLSVDEKDGTLFKWDSVSRFSSENFKLTAYPGSFYDDVHFRLDSVPLKEGFFSPVYVTDKTVPVHKWIEMSIKPANLPERLKDKAIIACINDKEVVSAGGDYKDGFVTTLIRSFGKFTVAVDTIPPEIKPVNIHNGKNITGYERIKIRIRDELSGISAYKPTMYGNWILMEYDPKNEMLVYYTDERMKKGKNNFRIEVIDQKKNRSVYEAELVF